MIIVMKQGSTQEDLDRVNQEIRALGYTPHVIQGEKLNVIGAIGDERGKARLQVLETLPGVDRVVPILRPFKLVSKEVKTDKSRIEIAPGVAIGNGSLTVFAGPCSIEGEEQMFETARAVKEAGAHVLRGGAFKPRTSPYSFQGMEEEGLKLLAGAGREYGMPTISECMNPMDLDLVARYVDVIQIGARNVQNFSLLKLVGQVDKPVMLKRGMMTTIEEYLMSAEYIASEGNHRVILCERGIRTFETATRNTLDLSAIPALGERTHLPVVVDPSHGTGVWAYVAPMSRAAVAAGADGLMIEVHPDPIHAMSDGSQSLKPENFAKLMREIKPFADAMERAL